EVVADLRFKAVDHTHDIIECALFFSEFLGLLRVVPDCWVFQCGVDCAQAIGFGIVVKDTSVGLARGCASPAGLSQSG
ncbi:MAG: hypothetical protein RL307_1418, partial [Pseudomonadota bacterium]